MLLLTFPELKQEAGAVSDSLQAANADAAVYRLWQEIVATAIDAGNDEDEFE